jgi:hypothetical protein
MMSPAAHTYRELYDDLLRLIDAGLGDNDDADALRDQMDAPWYAMTEDERAEYSRPVPVPPGKSQ